MLALNSQNRQPVLNRLKLCRAIATPGMQPWVGSNLENNNQINNFSTIIDINTHVIDQAELCSPQRLNKKSQFLGVIFFQSQEELL